MRMKIFVGFPLHFCIAETCDLEKKNYSRIMIRLEMSSQTSVAWYFFLSSSAVGPCPDDSVFMVLVQKEEKSKLIKLQSTHEQQDTSFT